MSISNYTTDSEKSRFISGNTAKDGTGTEYRILVDGNGRLDIVIAAGTAEIGTVTQKSEQNANVAVSTTTKVLPVTLVDASGNPMEAQDAVGRAGFQKITDGVDIVSILADGADNVSNAENQLVTAALNYGFDGTTWDRIRSFLPTASVADTDPLLGTVACLYGLDGTFQRIGANVVNADNETVSQRAINTVGFMFGFDGTNWDRLRAQSAYANIDDTLGILSVGAVIHGEDLEVGAGNSEPVKIRTDDDSLPMSEKHLIVIALNYVRNAGNTAWVRMTQP